MTKTDTSREAVERMALAVDKELGCCGSACADTLRALLTERDALRARAERAEAVRAAATEVVKLLWESMSKQEDIGPHGGYIYMKLRAALAQLDAEPADVSETAHREGWEQAKEAAAQYLENQAPFTEEQITSATSFALLDNIHQVARSRNCRRDAAAIRAMPYPGDSQ